MTKERRAERESAKTSLTSNFTDPRELLLLPAKLSEYLIATKDSVRFYHLCASCVEKAQTIGGPPPQEPLLFIV